ncbi:hypothetical protein MAR_013993 [Mya arenaria]|uniref:Uncharacterized protein n=1 Tax=Mya arenaria TaxID=6604 RepID=A0ABY7G442_MYAAR|nr:hypothetical protein MAR_013993 [Mya arenaria]
MACYDIYYDTVVGEPFRRNGQLFSIHAFIEKAGQLKQMPLSFYLMSRRTKVDFVSILESIKERIGTSSVEDFVADYEQEYVDFGLYRLVPLLRREAG